VKSSIPKEKPLPDLVGLKVAVTAAKGDYSEENLAFWRRACESANAEVADVKKSDEKNRK
jgi:hypothetical protein